jgi:repressor LexA
MESIGVKIRKQRRKLGLTLDELAGRCMMSKPYLSLIESGRYFNPPGDEKLERLEQTLGFASGELRTQANLQRTPREMRAVISQLVNKGQALGVPLASVELKSTATEEEIAELAQGDLPSVVQEIIVQNGREAEKIRGNVVPIINRIAAEYPMDFNDLSYPARIADQYIGCPNLNDANVFAVRVWGDSMIPKYREEDIVIFSPALAPRNGDDCFIRFANGRTTFRRIFFETNEDGVSPSVRLQPRNERYRATIVRSGEVVGFYRAVYRYHRVDDE